MRTTNLSFASKKRNSGAQLKSDDAIRNSRCRILKRSDTGPRRRHTQRKFCHANTFHESLEVGKRVGTVGRVCNVRAPLERCSCYRSTPLCDIPDRRSPARTSPGNPFRCGVWNCGYLLRVRRRGTWYCPELRDCSGDGNGSGLCDSALLVPLGVCFY